MKHQRLARAMLGFMWCWLQASWVGAQPAVKPIAVLPFVEDGPRILIKGLIHPYTSDTLFFIFDSGAELNILDASDAALWKLSYTQETGVSGLSKGMTYLPIVHPGSLQLGQAILPHASFCIENLKPLNSPSYTVDGILGYPLLAAYTVKIDYDHHLFILYPPGSFPYDKKGQVLRMDLDVYTPMVEAAISLANGTQLKSKYHITLGGNYGVLFNYSYVQKYHIDRFFQKDSGTITVQDMLRTIDYVDTELPAIEVGKYRLRLVPATYSPEVDDGNPQQEIAGAVGYKVWKKFNLIFNLSRHELYLEPNQHFGQ
ncbi:MAG: hypothetical protein K6T34_07245 [Thermoflavifilum sp.]|nr:hypothetical protein [Thermoflavifilum sp.]